MADEVKLPRLGQGMEMGTIVRWLKGEGDPVEKGDALYELDTDKVTQEVEAEASGVLLKIAVQEGEVPVGQTVAVIGQAGEDVSFADVGAPASAEKPAEAPARDAASARPPQRRPRLPRRRLRRTAAASRPARSRAASPASAASSSRPCAAPAPRAASSPRTSSAPRQQPQVQPSALPVPVATGEVESVPLTNIRKTIARRLTAAWTVPAFELTVSADMTRANDLVARVRERDPEVRVTVTDLLLKVCAQALARHPDVNVQFTDDALLRFPTANVGLAVATEQGLIVPVIRSAERLSLVELSRARGDLVGRAREGKLKTGDLEAGTFTISNLGMFGVEQFIAVLNPPQAAILAVGATEDRPVALNGEVVVRPMMTVTLTVDHRAVDGAPAAEFLGSVKALLEDPALAL